MEAVIEEQPKPKKNQAKEYLKSWVPYRLKRYWAYVLATIVALAMPFITIGGNHLFLLSFDHKKLHLAGVAFDMQELYLMPFLLMLLFLGIFAVTAVGGRAWCGWACPQTIFRVIYRDGIETKLLGLHKRIKNKQKKPDMSKTENQVKKVIAILLWSVLALIAAADFLWFFVPPEEFFVYLQNPGEHMMLFGILIGTALFIVADIVFIVSDHGFQVISKIFYLNEVLAQKGFIRYNKICISLAISFRTPRYVLTRSVVKAMSNISFPNLVSNSLFK